MPGPPKPSRSCAATGTFRGGGEWANPGAGASIYLPPPLQELAERAALCTHSSEGSARVLVATPSDRRRDVSDSQVGQPSHKIPDYIPGWYRRKGPSIQEGEEREAVRFTGAKDFFPLNFFREREAIWLPAPPQLGICIGLRNSDFWLSV